MNTDVIIVLGKGLHTDGTPDCILKSRVSEAVRLAEQNRAPLIFSGGKAHWKEDTKISEAGAMKRYVVESFPEFDVSRITLEEEGSSTIDQFIKIKTVILIPNGWVNIALVTDELHMPRAALALKHILGDSFRVDEVPAKADIAGGWRRLIEAREEKAYEKTLKTRVEKITKGDHQAWAKANAEFQKRFKDLQAQGMDANEIITKLVEN
jgi:uncharacterized SAM-binding protein YcdF (DUF218 family)